MDLPKAAQRGILQNVGRCEGEWVGIAGKCVGVADKSQGDALWLCVNDFEIAVASKSVLWEVIFGVSYAVGTVVDFAHDGEEDGCVAFPKFGLGLPYILESVFLHRSELGSVSGDLYRENVVVEFHCVAFFVLQRYE